MGGSTSGQPQDRRRDEQRGRREDENRRRISAQPGQPGAGPMQPSPALVRHGSKSRNIPAALIPGVVGTSTPNSAAAQVGVPVGTRRASAQQARGQEGHPYANALGEYGTGDEEPADPYATGPTSGAGYGRAPAMTSAAPPELSNVRARGGEVGVANGGEGYDGQQALYEPEPPKRSLLVRILTCHCG